MTYFSSFLLGLIQGLAEFLPISSSGHLAIAQNLLNIKTEVPEFFDVLLHLGTLVAVFVAYWRDICDMVVELIHGVSDLAHSSPSPSTRGVSAHMGLIPSSGSLFTKRKTTAQICFVPCGDP